MHNFAHSFSALLHKHCEKVTFERKCNFLFLFHIVNIITKISTAEAYLILKGMEIIMANRINLNQTSYHGAGAIEEIANEAKAHGFKKAFVCSDPDLVKFHVTSKVTDILEKNGLAYELYSDIKPNPTIENVQHGVQAFKNSGADYLIAIGGGSSMDTSKAIGIIIANPEFEDVRSLEGTAPTKKPCVPIIAVLALWSFVGMWNSYFDAMIYLNDANLQPLQLVLRSILVQNTPQPGMIADIQSTAEMAKVAEQLKYATIVVSSLPLLVMYPFFQKYFDKGIMVGSVKG